MNPHPIWKELWERCVPPKVHIFIWKHIETPIVCPACKIYPEDLRYMLFGCDQAKEVWDALGLGEAVSSAVIIDGVGSGVLEELICSDKPGGVVITEANAVELIMVAGRYIWWERRKTVHKEIVGTPGRTVMNIRGSVANCLYRKVRKPPVQEIWKRLASGIYKLNVDSSFDVDAGTGALGTILHDANRGLLQVVAVSNTMP